MTNGCAMYGVSLQQSLMVESVRPDGIKKKHSIDSNHHNREFMSNALTGENLSQ